MKSHRPAERPPAFTYRRETRALHKSDRELYAEDIPFARLAKRYGTPLYVYSASTIRQRFREFDQAFGGCEHTICYSVKANSNLSILRLLAGLGAGFDIVSGGELQRVIAAAKAKAKVVFSGVGKLAQEIDQALRSGILLFNVESASEMELLAARAAHHRKSANFAIRVNPDVAAKTHPYISTGLHQHKFGVPWRDAPALPSRRRKSLSKTRRSQRSHRLPDCRCRLPFAKPWSAWLRWQLHCELKDDIRFVDAGGGLGIQYTNSSEANFRSHSEAVRQCRAPPLKGLGCIFCSSRAALSWARPELLLTRVLYRKRNNGKQFVVVDAAMNDLLRPSLYGAYHQIVPVVLRKDRIDRES